MPDTQRTTAALQALFPDNTSGQITPQRARDLIVSYYNKLDTPGLLPFPAQAGNGGKYLTTDGSTLSWAAVSGGGGTSDHAALSNLSYAAAGHTGFAGTGVANTFTADQTVTGTLTVSGTVTGGTFSGAGTGLTGVALLAAANTFTVGNQQITNSAASQIPLTLKGAASQSTYYLRILNSANSPLIQINQFGNLLMSGGGSTFQNNNTAYYIQDTDGTNQPAVRIDGSNHYYAANWRAADAADSFYGNMDAANTTGNVYLYAAGSSRVKVAPSGAVQINDGYNAASTVHLTITGAASQSANLTVWKNNSGTAIAWVDSAGHFTVPNGSYMAAVDSGGTARRMFFLDGLNNMGWRNEADSGNAYYGCTNPAGQIILQTNNGGVYSLIDSSGQFAFNYSKNIPTNTVVEVVFGTSGHTANLTEWRNSAGSVLAAVAKNGAVVPASLADADAANGTLYYSTTASKLVFKDSGGVVNNLY